MRRSLFSLLTLGAAIGAGLGLSAPAEAQNYPTRQPHILVGYPAGGSTDILARLFGNYLSEKLGQQFIVENRPGAGNNIATEAVVKASPDGYTILLVNPANAVNTSLYKKLNFNFLKDIDPVGGFIRVPNVMEVNPDVPAKTVKEFIDYAKAKPDKVNVASSGNGTSIHLSGELFKMMTGIKMNHIPYRGSAPMMTDLIGGRIQFAFDGIATTHGYVRSNTVRLLGVSTGKRSPVLPDGPTISESAVPGFEASVWFALFAPAGTPKAVIDLLNSKVNVALSQAEVKENFLRVGNEPVGGGADVLAAKVQAELEKWKPIVREKNIRIDQ